MNNLSKMHQLLAFLAAIIITLAGLGREIAVDPTVTVFKGILYFSIILAISLIAILLIWRM